MTRKGTAPARSRRVTKEEPVARATKKAAPRPSQDDIAERAYRLYQERGCEDGHAVEDWLEAERQLLEEARSGR